MTKLERVQSTLREYYHTRRELDRAIRDDHRQVVVEGLRAQVATLEKYITDHWTDRKGGRK